MNLMKLNFPTYTVENGFINILLMRFTTLSKICAFKFLRDINFAVFEVNLSSMKFKPLKFHNTLETQGVITNDP